MEFYEKRTDASRVKTEIVTKYFRAWAKIMQRRADERGEPIAYVDLFSGPGVYEDGTPSTPIEVLQGAVEDPKLRNSLVTVFNDVNHKYAAKLRQEIDKLPGLDRLRYRPEVLSIPVGNELVRHLEGLTMIPTFLFADPWGYKGLSIDLLKGFIRNWGCDAVFFFNYNRINPAVTNETVRRHMDALFGRGRVTELMARVKGQPPHEREAILLDTLADAMGETGANYMLPFVFTDQAGTRTSHFLIFITKHFRGYEIMKEIMASASSDGQQGVASFRYCQADKRHPRLFEYSRPLDDLQGLLLEAFADRELRVREVYERHSVGRPYLSKDYKQALKELEREGRVLCDPDAGQRRPDTMADHVRVAFPPREESK